MRLKKSYLLKYQYFLQDVRLNEQLELNEFSRYQKEIIPLTIDSKLYRKVWSYPLGELPSKKGIKPVIRETKEKLDYFFVQSNLILTSQLTVVSFLAVPLLETVSSSTAAVSETGFFFVPIFSSFSCAFAFTLLSIFCANKLGVQQHAISRIRILINNVLTIINALKRGKSINFAHAYETDHRFSLFGVDNQWIRSG